MFSAPTAGVSVLKIVSYAENSATRSFVAEGALSDGESWTRAEARFASNTLDVPVIATTTGGVN